MRGPWMARAPKATGARMKAKARQPNPPNPNSWKLQQAKAQFSELVRRAGAGEPQLVTVHGKEAVVVFDPTRFELSPKSDRSKDRTMAGFLERSKKYDL